MRASQLQQRECHKRGYPSEREARSANRSNGKRLRAYVCVNCRAWHVTASGAHGK